MLSLAPYTDGRAVALAVYGVKSADVKSTLKEHAGTIAAGVATTLLAAAGARDMWKGRKHDEHWDVLNKSFKDKSRVVDSRTHIASRDPATVSITNKKELKAMVDHEFKELPKVVRKIIVSDLNEVIKQDGGNAAMLPGLSKQYVLSRPRELPEVLDHELGHAADFREKKLTHKNMGPYDATFIGSLYRPRYDKETMSAEIEAWRRAPDSPYKKKIEEAALGTYDTAFHRDRGELLTGLASIGAMVTANMLLSKLGADKQADHVQGRRAERTPSIPAPVIETLRADALKVDHPAEGNHYIPLKGKAGEHLGYAVFRTIDGKLRLMTILGKEMTPKGTSLGHVLHAKTAGIQSISSEAVKNLVERDGERRTDYHGPVGGHSLEGQKIASPRWAREIRSLLTGLERATPEVAASNLARARSIAAKMRDASPRQIMDLGQGLDANAVLMAGASPGNRAEPLYVAKFIEPRNNPTAHLRERALVSKILGSHGVPTHGAYAHGRGGVEIQDYAPFTATPAQRADVAQQTKDLGKWWLNRHVWDVNDHAGNVRVLADGTPVAIDARFDSGPGFARTVRGTVNERYRDQRQTGARALHAARAGQAQEVPPPKWHQDAAPHVAGAAWEYGPYVAGGAALAGLYYKDKRQSEDADGVSAPQSKTAGRIDPRSLAAFGQQLQPGDVVQFQTHAGDVAQQSLRKGLMHGAISTPIQKLTGSPQHHTALFAGVDPDTGKLKIIHNYEQGNKAKIVQDYLDNYAHQTSFHAYRPHGVTPEMGAAAAARASELAAGPSSYAKNNLLAAGVRAVSEKAPAPTVGAAGRRLAATMATHCDPTTGICSALPVDAYTPVVGREKAVEMMVGHQVPRHQEAIAATPASISRSRHMSPIGQYHPADQVSVARGIAQRVLSKGNTLAGGLAARLKR